MAKENASLSPLESNDETLEYPLRISKISLLNLRDDNAFISPLAIECAFRALLFPEQRLFDHFTEKFPLFFYNYFILDQIANESFSENNNEEISKYFHTELQIHSLTDTEQRKRLVNEIFKDFSQRVSIPLLPSQKILGQILVEPVTLISCCSLTFRPLKCEYWEPIWSLKFHSNAHLSMETEFYFTKGFFRVAFHETCQKIEIPGLIFEKIPVNLIILLPRCSSDLVHLYANIREYLDLPYTSAFIGVCLPKISLDIEMNLLESLKSFDDFYHSKKFTDQVYLSGARSFGHFSLSMSTEKSQQSSDHCLHSIDLSPVTPWMFFVNRPFLFFLTSVDSYLLIGQMLTAKIRSRTTAEFFSKM